MTFDWLKFVKFVVANYERVSGFILDLIDRYNDTEGRPAMMATADAGVLLEAMVASAKEERIAVGMAPGAIMAFISFIIQHKDEIKALFDLLKKFKV